jgi:hypothetical protein
MSYIEVAYHCEAALIFGVGFVSVEKMDTLLLSMFFVYSGFGKMDKDSSFMFMVHSGAKKMDNNFISIFLAYSRCQKHG